MGTFETLLCGLIHCKVHWSVGRRLGLCRLIAQPLIGSIIMELSISSVLWVLEVLFCVVYIDRVSIKSITACYGGFLLSSE